jgi:prepilin-type N-terminal cleavage/methylation domain-containing protein/prepilin-type processing-associated H-X9-DG protein
MTETPRGGRSRFALLGKKSRAFTLIELLVVMAVIAILAGILFPVFAQAREKARQASCASRTKNLGTAVMLYTQDYDEQLPLAAYATSDVDFITWHDLTDPYTRNKTIWHCPSSSVETADAGGKPTTHFGYNVHYLTTLARDFSNANGHRAVALAAVPRPAETVLLADARASIHPSWCGDDGKFLLPPSQADAHCWGRPNPLHQGGSNLAFVDGHVKWLRPERFYIGQEPVDRYFALQ